MFEVQTAKWTQATCTYTNRLAVWEAANSHLTEEDLAAVGPRGSKRQKTGNRKPSPPEEPSPRMQEDKPENLLRLATALKILLSVTITDNAIPRGETLYQNYLLEFRRVSLYYFSYYLHSTNLCAS